MSVPIVETVATSGGVAVAHRGPGDVHIIRGYAISLEAFQAYAREFDVTEAALDRFFQTLEHNRVPREQLDETLREIAAHFKRLRCELRAFRPDDDFLCALRDRASAVLEGGNLEEAEQLLDEAQQLELRTVAAARRVVESRSLSAAKLGAMRADVLSALLRFVQAADVLAKSVDLIPVGEEALELTYLNRLSEAERVAGRFERALKAGQRAVRLCDRMLDEDGPEYAEAQRNLGLALRELGWYVRAERLLRDALDTLRRATGDSGGLLGLLSDLAGVLRDQGRLGEAEEVQAQARTLAEEAEGTTTAALGRFWHQAGRLSYEQRRWGFAEHALRRAIEIRRAILPPDHPDLTRTMNDLALLYRELGRLDEAEPLYREALAIQERVLGEDHPEIATTLDHLGSLFMRRAEYSNAKHLYERAVALIEAKLGPVHPDLGQSLNNLGQALQAIGDYRAAQESYLRAVDVLGKVLGDQHPELAAAVHNLAVVAQLLQHPDEAEDLCSRALAIRERALGENHTAVADSLGLRGLLRHEAGRFDEAAQDYERALSILEGAFGRQHAQVAQACTNLVRLYLDRGQPAAALSHALGALAIAKRASGRGHPVTATAANNLGHTAFLLNRHKRAYILFEAALEAQRRAHGRDHPEIATCLNNLAATCEAIARPDRAECLYIEMIAMQERLWGKDHPEVALGLNNLARLYEDSGRQAEAGPLFERALRIASDRLGPQHPWTCAFTANHAAWLRRQMPTSC